MVLCLQRAYGRFLSIRIVAIAIAMIIAIAAIVVYIIRSPAVAKPD
jgi:hypothetical protein